MTEVDGSSFKKTKKEKKAAGWEQFWQTVAEEKLTSVIDSHGKVVQLSVAEPKTKADRELRFHLAIDLQPELLQHIIKIKVSNVCLNKIV